MTKSHTVLLLADRTQSLLNYDSDYNMPWECSSLLQIQGRNYNWCMLITDIPLVFVSDWSRVKHVSFFWIVRHKGTFQGGAEVVCSVHFFPCVRWYYVWVWYMGSVCLHELIILRTESQHTEDSRKERENEPEFLMMCWFSARNLLFIARILFCELTLLHCQSHC